MPINENDPTWPQQLTSHEKKIEDIAFFGIVIATEFAMDTGKVRVTTEPDNPDDEGFLVSWLSRRSGNDREWWAPEKDEQVMIISPGGDLEKSYIIGSLPYPKKKESVTPAEKGKRWVLAEGENPPPQPSKTKDESSAHVIQYQDKTTTAYDKKLHIFQATFLEDKTIDLKVDAKKDEEKAELKIKELNIALDAKKDEEKVELKIKEDIIIKIDGSKDKNKIDIKVKEVNVAIDATNGEEKVTINVKDKTTMTMDAKDEAITIDSKGEITVKAKDITLTLAKDGSVTLDCKKLTITSNGDVAVDATGKVAVTGNSIELNC